MSLKRNVLIFHAGALGDFVLSWPLAMAAGRLFAQSRVFYVASRQKGELAEKVLRLESSDGDVGWHGLFAADPQLPPPQQKLLAGAHTVVSFVAAPGSTWEKNVRAVSGATDVLLLDAHPPDDFAAHHTDFLLAQLTSNVVWQQGVSQMLASVRQRGVGIPHADAGPVAIHPGSGSPQKCWPLDNYLDLAVLLKKAGRTVRFIVGEAETERWDDAGFERLASAGELHRPASLVELFNCLRDASAFIGNDSGPGHLAGVLGLPTVSLFGPTDPARWRPIGPAVKVIRRTPLSKITAEEVFDALKSGQWAVGGGQ